MNLNEFDIFCIENVLLLFNVYNAIGMIIIVPFSASDMQHVPIAIVIKYLFPSGSCCTCSVRSARSLISLKLISIQLRL